MAIFKIKIINAILHFIDILETFLNKGFVFIRVMMRKTKESTDTPNNSKSWERIYLSQVTPIKKIRSEIALTIKHLTKDNEFILETGCGSGSLSAELAIAGRRIAVCDFSQQIIKRVKLLFNVSGLPEPQTYLVDLTKPLPFKDNQFDVVWNSGVLEHWTDDELQIIVAELARCAKRCVISLVPNERSLFYRYGRESAEAYKICPWGKEMPRSSLKHIFEDAAGLSDVAEKTICLKDAPDLISIIDPILSKKLNLWWNTIPDNDPVKNYQGYLLLTIGYKK